MNTKVRLIFWRKEVKKVKGYLDHVDPSWVREITALRWWVILIGHIKRRMLGRCLFFCKFKNNLQWIRVRRKYTSFFFFLEWFLGDARVLPWSRCHGLGTANTQAQLFFFFLIYNLSRCRMDLNRFWKLLSPLTMMLTCGKVTTEYSHEEINQHLFGFAFWDIKIFRFSSYPKNSSFCEKVTLISRYQILLKPTSL